MTLFRLLPKVVIQLKQERLYSQTVHGTANGLPTPTLHPSGVSEGEMGHSSSAIEGYVGNMHHDAKRGCPNKTSNPGMVLGLLFDFAGCIGRTYRSAVLCYTNLNRGIE